MVIAFTGYSGDGKTEAAVMARDLLSQEHTVHYVSMSRLICESLAGFSFGDTDVLYDNRHKCPEAIYAHGRAMEKLHGMNYWIIKAIPQTNTNMFYLIDSIRTVAEAIQIYEYNGIVIRLKRNRTNPNPSENEIDLIKPTYTIYNYQCYSNLRYQIYCLLKNELKLLASSILLDDTKQESNSGVI